jgi:hypothetical protein
MVCEANEVRRTDRGTLVKRELLRPKMVCEANEVRRTDRGTLVKRELLRPKMGLLFVATCCYH